MRQVEINCLISHRTQAILRLLEVELQMNLQDYVIVAKINNQSVVLGDD